MTLLGKPYNLHQVWDGELINTAGMSESEYFDRLRHEMDSLHLPDLETGSVVDWAMEGHRIAREHAYQVPRSGTLGQAYVDANLPVVDLALIKAGVRLAKVLNEALAHYQPGPARLRALHSGPTSTPTARPRRTWARSRRWSAPWFRCIGLKRETFISISARTIHIRRSAEPFSIRVGSFRAWTVWRANGLG